MARVDRFNFKGFKTKDDIRAFEEENKQYELPNCTYSVLLDSQKDNPNEPGLSYFMLGNEFKKPFTFTYTLILQEVNRVANMLYADGLSRSDVIGVVLPNMPEMCFSLIAAETVGIVFPMNPLLESAHLKELMNAANVKVLITIAPFVKTDVWEKVDSIRGDVPSLKIIYQVNMNNYLRGIKKGIVGLIMSMRHKGKSTKNQEIRPFEAHLDKFSATSLDFKVNIKPSDPAAYFHTGGTTGRPKIAVQTQDNICFDSWATGGNLDTSMKGFNMYGGLPLFHVFGAMITLSLVWAGSGHLVLVTPKGFRGDGVLPNFWKTIQHYKINFIAAVPAIYKMLDDIPINGSDVSSVKFAISGAAPLPPEVMRSFEEKTGVKMLEGYGSTEGTCIASVNPPYGERKVGSVGYPIPYSDIKIFDISDTDVAEAPIGEIGLVCLSGRNVFSGYLEEEHNTGAWITHKGVRYFNSGDLGRYDEDGYLFLTGRKKELIIRGGHNIDPKTIEEPLYAHPAVEMAAAVGRPDGRVGELPVVYIELKKGVGVSTQELMAFATANIAEKAAVPKEIIIIDEIPLTTIGKIFKPTLCMMEIKQIYTATMLPDFPNCKIEVVNSKKTGFTAQITGVNLSDESKIRSLLGSFPYPFEILE